MTRSTRNLSVDILRGMTMVLMVCVNDFWTVLNVPHGLEHFATWEDGIGLSDIVYPLFLFVMGMSIPLAIDRRFDQGYAVDTTLSHIFSRTLALLLMGSFIVNAEGDMAPLLAYSKGVYWLVMVLGFFLCWNAYPRDFCWKGPLRCLGAACLLFLALTFRTPDGGLFRASWWGILGQIGWMYLFSALAYLFLKERPWALLLIWIGLMLVNLSVAPMRDGTCLSEGHFFSDFAAALQLGNGHSAIMSLGGVLLTLVARRVENRSAAQAAAPWRTVLITGLALVLLLLAAWASHLAWIASKNLGTLPWCLAVTALGVALYAILRFLEQRQRLHGAWLWPFQLAGTSTLSVYMMPYIYYSFWVFFSPSIPLWLSGWVGVGKCLLFSLLCVCTAYGLGRMHIRLKI